MTTPPSKPRPARPTTVWRVDSRPNEPEKRPGRQTLDGLARATSVSADSTGSERERGAINAYRPTANHPRSPTTRDAINTERTRTSRPMPIRKLARRITGHVFNHYCLVPSERGTATTATTAMPLQWLQYHCRSKDGARPRRPEEETTDVVTHAGWRRPREPKPRSHAHRQLDCNWSFSP